MLQFSSSRILTLLAFFTLSVALSTTLRAATITVPFDRPTIQSGINAAVPGDTIVVLAGIYSGTGNHDIDFGGKNIVVRSAAGPLYTTIDCGGSASEIHIGFYFHASEDTTCVLDGFTVINAYTAVDYDDGAIICSGASPTIRNCVVTQSHGNGFRVRSNAYPHVVDCQSYYNSDDGFDIGSDFWPLAGGLISGCLSYKNSYNGFTVHALDSCRIVNCTAVANQHHGIELFGDLPKQDRSFGAPTDIVNSIAAYNRIGGIVRSNFFHTYSIYYCDSYGNGMWNYSSVDTFLAAPFGNFTADPLFCDTSAILGFHLQPGSPCLGENNASGLLIGAFGPDCQINCGDADNSGGVTISDAVHLINYIFGGGPAPDPAEVADVDCGGNINISDVVYLIAYIFSGGPAPCAGC